MDWDWIGHGRLKTGLLIVVLVVASFSGFPGGNAARAAGNDGRADLIGFNGNAFPWEPNWSSFTTLLDNSHAGWARVELQWNQVEPNRNSWRWGSADSLVNAYADHGFQELGLLCYSVGWASGRGSSNAVLGPPTDLGAWQDYVRAVVTRYHGQIHAWEIWNEPDTGAFWNGRDGGDPAGYLQLLQSAYQVIKSVDPSATVVSAGVTGTGRGANFLNRLLDLGGGRYLDMIGINAYLSNDGLTNPDFINKFWPKLRQARQRAGKPIWITELGWSSGGGASAAAGSEGQQATNIAEQLPLVFTLGDVAHALVFQFKDPNTEPNTFGITRPNGTSKPAYTAVQTIAGRLVGLRFERQVDLGVSGVTDIRFSSSSRTVDVVWAAAGGKSIHFPTGWSSVQVWQIDGSHQGLSPEKGDVRLRVGPNPILVEQAGATPAGIARCQYFPQTRVSLCGSFLQYWQSHGGTRILGLPVSPQLTEDGRTVQYLERSVLEYHPEWLSSGWAVVGRLVGREITAGREQQAPFQPVNAHNDANCRFFPQTGHRLCFGFKTFWNQYGGLQVFGFPISEEFREKNPDTGKIYTVQYFERARFEYHPDERGTPYEVQLGRLGAELYARR